MLGTLDARLQGELLQVHQRDAPLARGRVAALRAQRSLAARQRRLRRAAATSWRSPATRSCSSTTALARSACPRCRCSRVLPGTGGLTRLVDKRKVRRDLADVFSHPGRGRARASAPWSGASSTRSSPQSQVRRSACRERAQALARAAPTRDGSPGVALTPLDGEVRATTASSYRYVDARDRRRARASPTLTVRGPAAGEPPTRPRRCARRGSELWALRAFRELDDALLDLRFNHPDDRPRRPARPRATPRACSRVDAALAHAQGRLVRARGAALT